MRVLSETDQSYLFVSANKPLKIAETSEIPLDWKFLYLPALQKGLVRLSA